MIDVYEKAQGLWTHIGMSKKDFKSVQLINLQIKKMKTFEELGYTIPLKSRFELRAAMRKGYVTIPVIYGVPKNEVYDMNSRFVCSLIEK